MDSNFIPAQEIVAHKDSTSEQTGLVTVPLERKERTLAWVLIVVLNCLLVFIVWVYSNKLGRYEEPRDLTKALFGFASILATLFLGVSCFCSFFLVSDRSHRSKWLVRALWVTTSVAYGVATTNYHPSISFLACVAAFVAIEHLQSLASTETSVNKINRAAESTQGTVKSLEGASAKIDTSLNLILNRQGVRELRGYLHKYYVENYTVRGSIFFWDWQLYIKQDLKLLEEISVELRRFYDLTESTNADASLKQSGRKELNANLTNIIQASHLHSHQKASRAEGAAFPEFATSCFLLRLVELILSPNAEPFSAIQFYAASPILNDQVNLGVSLPLYNYRAFEELQCIQNYYGCCAQSLFISKFNACLHLAVRAKLVAGESEGQYRTTNVSRIKLDLVTSPPWHYAISRTVTEPSGKVKEGFVTQLFRSVSRDDVAVDITAEEVPGSKPFVPKRVTADQGSVESSTETFARYDDHLQRLVLESVALEPYLVSVHRFYELTGKDLKKWEEKILDNIPFLDNLPVSDLLQDASKSMYSESLEFYKHNLMPIFLEYESENGRKRVPGQATKGNAIIRRIL